MKKIVIKFGGSNLRTKEDVARIIKVISGCQTAVVIVISALYGVTDALLKTIRQAPGDREVIRRIKRSLMAAHLRIATLYIDKPEHKKTVVKKIKDRVNTLEKYLLGIHYLGEAPDFVRDLVLSYGERLSSLLLTSILNSRGLTCEEVLPEQLGLVTNGEYGNAEVDFAAAEKNLKEYLSGPKRYIVPGFYGISPNCRVTLLGRGGSDYSAAAIGRCIGAASVDLWKDVDGFMSADPGIVKNPVSINSLTYREAAELSYFGAQILHPRTFEPLMDKKIPLRLFNIKNFSGKGEPLTIINNKLVIKEDVVKSVTFSDDFGILKLTGPGVGIKPGIMAKVTTRLHEGSINIKSIITAQTSINILLAREDLPKSYRLVKEMGLPTVEQVSDLDHISLIAVVGEGMLDRPGIAARVFGAVSRHKVNILIISAGASSVATYFIIERKDREKTIRSIHEEFFG